MRRLLLATLALGLTLSACAAAPDPASDPASDPAPDASTMTPSAPPAPATASEPAVTTPSSPDDDLVKWPDNTQVSHIFYHSLIVDPKRAFAKNEPMRGGYQQYMVTISEFTKQLQSIYDAGYVLVQPTRLAAPDDEGVMRATPLYLPKGKKPLVLSIDDVSYYSYMDNDGFASNLTLTPEGKVVNTYTDAEGTTTTGAYDVSTVVDEFVAAHPDFSHQGDKGVIALTGYEGVLGYRSSLSVYGDNATTRDARAQAKAVADAMKAQGWSFASHSFGHIDMTRRSLSKIQSDTRRWKADVAPIVGDTPMLIFAFGADIQRGVTRYGDGNPKFKYLHGQGYRYFFPIDASTPAWAQLTSQSLRQARINIDGITMQRTLNGRTKLLNRFFTTKDTLDPLRPMPTPGV